MKTFLMFGKSSSEELKEISLKYRTEIVSLVNNLGGDVRSMYVMLGEKSLVFIFAFPGTRGALQASTALSKLTGISFTTSPVVPVDEFIVNDLKKLILDSQRPLKIRPQNPPLPPFRKLNMSHIFLLDTGGHT